MAIKKFTNDIGHISVVKLEQFTRCKVMCVIHDRSGYGIDVCANKSIQSLQIVYL